MATKVQNILNQPLITHKYTTLKERLIERFQPSSLEAVARTLEKELTNSNSYKLMDRILALEPHIESSFLFREIFLCKLPPHNSD